MSLIDVLGIGEPLVQFNPLDQGPMRYAHLFEKHAAGSESNIVIGISRLGHRTALITKLGYDEMSEFVLSTLRAEKVETRWIARVEGKNCGIFVVQRNYPVPGKSDVLYYRGDSAARLLSADDIDPEAIKRTKILHVSGITPALSQSCRAACFRAIALAKRYGTKFSFDPNFRRKLWTADQARPIFLRMASSADIIFTTREEARIILGKSQPDDKAVDGLSDLGPKTVVLKLGAKGGLLARSSKTRARVYPYGVSVVDVIGAGDATVSGFLSGMLTNEKLQRCLQMASASSALTVMRRGDFENLPTSGDLQKFLLAFEEGKEVEQR